jgi:hypothetical protein
MATEKQLAANRRNSQNSSGPRNTTRSRYNALQHGLCAEHFELNPVTQYAPRLRCALS